MASKINFGDPSDKDGRQKLIAYYHVRVKTLDEFKKNAACCLKCKVANQLLTQEQGNYWARVAADIDDWVKDMGKYERNETNLSPGSAWTHSLAIQTGQPGVPIVSARVEQVPVEEYCPDLAGDQSSQPQPTSEADQKEGGEELEGVDKEGSDKPEDEKMSSPESENSQEKSSQEPEAEGKKDSQTPDEKDEEGSQESKTQATESTTKPTAIAETDNKNETAEPKKDAKETSQQQPQADDQTSSQQIQASIQANLNASIIAIVPQAPSCYLAQAEASTKMQANSAKFRLNTTAEAKVVASQFCSPVYYVQRRERGGELETKVVYGQGVAVVGKDRVLVAPEQEKRVWQDCGCDPSAKPVQAQDLGKLVSTTEMLQRVEEESINIQAHSQHMSFSSFVDISLQLASVPAVGEQVSWTGNSAHLGRTGRASYGVRFGKQEVETEDGVVASAGEQASSTGTSAQADRTYSTHSEEEQAETMETGINSSSQVSDGSSAEDSDEFCES
ncbi:hypothetical protein XA68_12940 [Ophiocordyceps unilateralis]|uniref:Uncharacterized protein n=1 Tax=Ophiocordyceps unilateralis TaxID=268505 RepID=A0A2A9PCH5_OPHUN|nr:hypothetical protein XA68_12940 [Ophiocordyceps unilateralis]